MPKLRLMWLLAAVLAITAMPASAQTAWPTKPVTLVVPFSAGGNTDVLARIFANRLLARLGQQFVIENRTGAGGTIGTAAVAKAAPDGYTLGIGTASNLSISPHVYKDKLSYDVQKDIVPLVVVATQPHYIVVHPSVPPKTMPELIAHMKANPDKLSYGTSGVGSAQHLCMEQIAQMTGVKIAHVPYRGSNQIMQDMISGQIQLTCDTFSTAHEQVKGGTLRGIAVTSPQRYPVVPEVPAVAETVPGFDVVNYWVFMAPQGLPSEVSGRLVSEIVAIAREPETEKQIKVLGAMPGSMSGAAAADMIKADLAKWGPIIEKAGLKQP